MSQDKQEIIDSIKKYILRNKGKYSLWYVGAGSNARDCLFKEHKTREKRDLWIYKIAASPQVALEVEKYFLIVLV